jgi:hypothetical protein
MPSSRSLRGTLLPLALVVGTLAVAFAVATTGRAPGDSGPGAESLAELTRPADFGRSPDGRGDHECEGRETIALPPGLRPEGITSDGDETFFVGSLGDGRVVRGDFRSGETEVLVPGRDGRVAVGMRYDARHDRLWVAGGPTGAVTVYDAVRGEQLGRWLTPGSVFLNDVTVTPDAVFVTDSGVQRLVVVPLGAQGRLPDRDGATTLPLTGEFEQVPNDFNANGIRALGNDQLMVIQGNTGTLFLVDAGTGETRAVELTRGRLEGGDGLEFAGNRLAVVRGGGDNTVAMVTLSQGNRSARVDQVIRDVDFDVPTTATFADGRLWTVNARFDTEATPTTPYDVVRVDLD